MTQEHPERLEAGVAPAQGASGAICIKTHLEATRLLVQGCLMGWL